MGAWPPGTVLPNEAALASQHGVAVGTIRRALADLTAEGLLSRRRKTGTVVTGRSPQHSLRFFFQYFRLHGADGRMLHSETQTLSVARIPAAAEAAAALALPVGTTLLQLRRLRRVDAAPVMHDRLILPEPRVPDFPTDPQEVPALLYRHLLERYGIRVTAVRESLTAALATSEDRALLGLGDPEAVLHIDEVAYDQAGAPIILARHVASTSRHSYVNEIR
jgi:GntR family transcriptional regulator